MEKSERKQKMEKEASAVARIILIFCNTLDFHIDDSGSEE